MQRVNTSSETFSTLIVSFLVVCCSAITRPVCGRNDNLKMALPWVARA